MQTFVARPFTSGNPNEQTLGVVVGWMTDNLMADSIVPILKNHHFDTFDPKQWYPSQSIQNVVRDLCKEPDTMNIFVAIGKKFAAELPFSPDVKTIQNALMSFNDSYHRINQGAHPDEGLLVEVGQNSTILTVTNNTPWPGEMIYGMLSSLGSRFTSSDGSKVVLAPPDPYLRSVFEVTC